MAPAVPGLNSAILSLQWRFPILLEDEWTD